MESGPFNSDESVWRQKRPEKTRVFLERLINHMGGKALGGLWRLRRQVSNLDGLSRFAGPPGFCRVAQRWARWTTHGRKAREKKGFQFHFFSFLFIFFHLFASRGRAEAALQRAADRAETAWLAQSGPCRSELDRSLEVGVRARAA